MPIAGAREGNRSTSTSNEQAMLYVSGHQGVHPVWPGAVPDKRMIVVPGGKLPSEQKKAGLRPRSVWPGVFVDLYTSRLRNMDVTIIVVSAVLVGRAVSNVAAVEDIESPLYFRWAPLWGTLLDVGGEQCRDVLRLDSCLYRLAGEFGTSFGDVVAAVLLFLADVLAGTIVWIAVALVLAGNNAFVGTSPVGKMWNGALAVILVAGTVKGMNELLGRLQTVNPVMLVGSTEENDAGGVKIENALLLTMDFLYVCLSVAGSFTCLSACLTSERHNAFHRSEMAALWYTTSSFKPPANVESLRLEPPKEGDVLLLSPQELGKNSDNIFPYPKVGILSV
jgi:hypothetical protein